MYYDRTSRVNNSYQPRKSWNNSNVRPTQGGGGGGGRQDAVHRGYTNDLPLRMLVNAKYVGAIIGQGGSNIRQVTRESKARCVVDVTRTIREGPGNLVEKAINIYGNPENCSQACMKILDIVMRETQADVNNQGRAPEPELKLLAHNNLVGRLIGKGGSSIKKIMEDTSCTVFVSNINELSSFNMDRTVTVRGTPANIAKAESKISMKLRQCWEHDMNNTLDAMYTGSGHPLIGSPAHYGTESPLAGAYPQYTPYAPQYQRGGSVPAVINRSATGTAAAAAVMNTSVSSRVGSQQQQQQDSYLAANQYGQNNIHSTFQTEVVHVWVPNTVVGALIGTKGAQIRQVMRVTGAHIRIESTKPDFHQRNKTGSGNVTGTAGNTAVSTGNINSAGNTGTVGNTGPAPPAPVNPKQQQQQNDKEQQQNDRDRERMERNSDRRVTITGTEVQQYKSQFWVFQRVCEHSFMFFDEVRLCTEVQVPSRMVGRIIGKKGQNVRELQRYTGAQVKIPEDSDAQTGNSEDTVVRIIGNFNASQAVQNRIRQLLYQFNGQPGGGVSYQSTSQHGVALMSGENGVGSGAPPGGRRQAAAEPLIQRSTGAGGDRCYYAPNVNTAMNYHHHAGDTMIKAS